MPLGISRLVLSVSSIRRKFGAATILPGAGLDDLIITQDGNFIQLQQSDDLLIINQDFDTTGDTIITQAGLQLFTQDDRVILTQRES